MQKEPTIQINGKFLTKEEAMTVRIALRGFASEVSHGMLGNDEEGKQATKSYTQWLAGIRTAMFG